MSARLARLGLLSAVVLAILPLLSGCSRPLLPRVNLPGAGAANASTAALVENRVWLEQDGGVGSGYMAFLSDGTLVEGTCTSPPRFAAWRWVDEAELVWDGVTGPVRAEIVAAGPQHLVLAKRSQGGASQGYLAVRPPGSGC
jgi:hypothetical protein